MGITKYFSWNFGEKRVVWIEKINQWIQFEEPAFFVFEQLFTEPDPETIISNFKSRYDTKLEVAEEFVLEIKKNLERLLQKPFKPDENSIFGIPDFIEEEMDFWSACVYRSNGRNIKFSYSSELLEYYIHHSFSHLIRKNEVGEDAEFQVVKNQGLYYLNKISPVKKQWKCEDIPTLKRRVFIEFSNAIYNKDNQEWMSIIHGAALELNLTTILLCSSTGSGKSTLAALMQNQGYTLLSDDFVPVDFKSLKIYPFPASVSVKSGSFNLLKKYYPVLSEQPEVHFRLTNKSLRFMPPLHINHFDYHPRSLKHIVFVNYVENKEVELRELQIPEALILFNEEAWISHEPEKAKRFMDWFSGMKFFKLDYGNSSEVVKMLNSVIFR